MINKLYVQGGQRPDPKDHLFGVASSPKVTDLCIAGCNDASTATWKTVLVMTEGYGGRDTFMLDITAPLPTHFAESVEMLGFDPLRADLPLDEVKFSETLEGKKRAALNIAKARRKDRKGERRGRGSQR